MEIDVSKCCYYNGYNSPFCCELYNNECEAQNCYFQQLQQLKAENESLQSLNDFNVQKIETLEAENEELKNQVFNWEEINKIQEKFEQCLDEIEEIVNKYKVGSGNLYGTICIPDVIRIAEKIKEVKE